ncbi:hypothetical protein RGT17_09070 [Bacillus altitudinis]|nr:hypothetical protein [Bacillus altitudinis]
MSAEETEVDWKDWIVNIAINYAVPLAGEYLSDLIRQHFSQNQNKMEIMFKKAVDEVCSRVAELLDEAFKNQYLSDCRHVSNQLRIYQETHDRDVITNAQIEASRLASRLYDMGYKASGGFFIASNLHLVSLRALAEVDSTYRNALQGFTQDYIEKGTNLNSKLDEVAKSFIPSECEWVIKPTKMRGTLSSSDADDIRERYLKLTGKYLLEDSVNLGEYHLITKDVFKIFPSHGYLLEIDKEYRETHLQLCTKTRQTYIDENVNPLKNIIYNMDFVLNNWSKWRIE